MDHIGIDLHKKDSQMCILVEGVELLERRIRTDPRRFAEMLGARARAHPPRGLDGERVGRPVFGGARPPRRRRRPELRPHVRHPHA